MQSYFARGFAAEETRRGDESDAAITATAVAEDGDSFAALGRCEAGLNGSGRGIRAVILTAAETRE